MSTPNGYQNVFRVAKPNSLKNKAPSLSTRRNRQPVSCIACRMRKLKCDRQEPCSACSKKSSTDRATCTFYNTGQGDSGKDKEAGEPRASEAQLRLQKLEQMVTNLLQSSKQDPESHNSLLYPNNTTGGLFSDIHYNFNPVERPLTPLTMVDQIDTSRQILLPRRASLVGQKHLGPNIPETRYFGATNWKTVLENIRDIQVVLDNDPDPQGANDTLASTSPDLDIFIDTTQPLTLKCVFDSLPPRSTVDKLLSIYFNAKHNQSPIIHSTKFLRDYESFWLDPSPVSFLWISILFSALYLGSKIHHASSKEAGNNFPNSDLFLARAGQALVTGKYHKGRQYSIEALILYALCKHTQKDDPESSSWVIMGVAARLSLRMGYHRDPRHIANISPFEGEMRRRTFFMIECLDLLLSFQAGLPPVIQEEDYDTGPPSNLLDTDFDEDCVDLPPSRPRSDPTPMLYYCEKSRLARVLRRVTRHALSHKDPSYEETMRLDSELREEHAALPPSLKVKPLSSSITDSTLIILHRLNLEILCLRSHCVLHRKYLGHDRANPAYDYSRKACTDAALKLLKYQAELHVACQPGGQLYSDRWMPSTLILYDFLLAVMVLCLELYESQRSPTRPVVDLRTQTKYYDAVRVSYNIWLSRRDSSREAQRASRVLTTMLSKVSRPDIPFATVVATPEPLSLLQDPFDQAIVAPITPPTSQSLWSRSEHETADLSFPIDDPILPEFYPEDYLNVAFSESDELDWGLIDHCLVGRGDIQEIPLEQQSHENARKAPGT